MEDKEKLNETNNNRKNIKKQKRIMQNSKQMNSFLGVFSIINTHFWKAFVGPFFAFGYPIVFVIILGAVFNYEMILGSSITIGPVAVACVSLPTAIFEFKKSTLLKRIGASNIKPLAFLSYTAFYYFFVMVLSAIWTALVALMVFGPQYFNEGKVLFETTFGSQTIAVRTTPMKDLFTRIHWAGYIYSAIVLTLVSIAVGLFIVSVSKSILTIQAIGSSLLIISMFLTGQVLPISQIIGQKVMWYLSYITPFKSPITQNTMAFSGSAYLSSLYDGYNFTAGAAEKIYALNNLQTFLETIAKNTETNIITATQIHSKGSALFPESAQIKAYIDEIAKSIKMIMFNLTDHAINKDDAINLTIRYNSYNIFNATEVYKSINALKTYEGTNLTFDEAVKNSIYEILKKAVNENENDNYIKLLNGMSNQDLCPNIQDYPYKVINGKSIEKVKDLDLNKFIDDYRKEMNESMKQSMLAVKTNEIYNLTMNNIKTNYKNFIDTNKAYVQLSQGGINKDSILEIGSVVENYVNFILPWLWIVVLVGLSQKSFTWNTR
ncbi:hypothetical protein MBIO_0204 [Mycoplasmopsis fermentans PG18]|uniref:Uncharacterized protein n=3 Tax=Mycoplasmopsis fermentans TaxID=2115 RepID=C4XE97_MYCFP|nr:ABC transporter permease [Mycoplasmopsis fermentans]ADV34166.1 Hypothetical Protein MfeM64YM_0159 [Mycoplasmopsis fermentans M64]BAH69469.1 hypothetical protein MBIO_0204 [Mycoplasmopsis fermentans PG18]VEU60196.1 Uncharacterised protein [Mycoplasmopsis fermentans]VEU67663.1 Uncharacterised protein [Mesomycoplasma conjunctivae]